MKAARYHGNRDLRVEDVPVPHPGEGQVQIAVEWCGLCGSDLHEYLDGPVFLPTPRHPHPLTGNAIPIVQGHEFAGVVAELGPGVTGLSEGDRVAVEPLIVCGHCVACRQGRYNVCRTLGFVGLDGRDGGFAERVVVDAAWVHPIPDLTAEQGALIEPLAVGYHAARLSGLRRDQTAAVFGAGPIGLTTIAALRALGAGRVVAVEPARARRSLAAAAGAHVAIDPADGDPVEQITELTGGDGVDVTFDCAGIEATLNGALAATTPGGTCVDVALWSRRPALDMTTLIFSEVRLLGSVAYAGRHREVIDLVRDGAIDTGAFVTGRIALDDIVDRGYRELIDHKETNVKILVHP